ncbi:MAG: OmpH family outer membrane protein [Pseudomonadales bacterium]|nr:OmpH family outer membrane protein [Pseudomonadales bacterium]
MKRTTISVVIAVVLLFGVHGYAAEKVGYINVQRIVSNSDMGKEAAAEITRMREAENAKIRALNEELNTLKTKFAEARQQQDASETDLVAQLETIQLKDKQLQRFVDDAKEYLAKKDKELVARILRKVDPLLEKIAKKRDYTIIIKDPNALAYLSPKADLSDEVVKSLNAARD